MMKKQGVDRIGRDVRKRERERLAREREAIEEMSSSRAPAKRKETSEKKKEE